MIQLLSAKYSRPIAFILVVLFGGTAIPAYGNASRNHKSLPAAKVAYMRTNLPANPVRRAMDAKPAAVRENKVISNKKMDVPTTSQKKDFNGGPSQPEMSSFKSIGADNMVDLFTGDFSYNIPLLDVGGYAVNLFYDGGITMEQEASWVGLGWNLNPGNIARNMRGVPDDFNGDDQLLQKQDMKENKTWGVTFGGDLELLGVKELFGQISLDASFDISFNNYLGPALGLGIKGGTNFSLVKKSGTEKSAIDLGASLGANINSRNGLTISPNVSLTANAFGKLKGLSTGIGIKTSYNSKAGIKQLQISEQMSYNYAVAKNLGKLPGLKPIGADLLSVGISFAKPSYTPSIRMPVQNEAQAGHFQFGGGIWGLYGSFELEAYRQVSKPAFIDQTKPMVGYLYYEKAKDNPHAVMDFTRLNENEVTPNTPIISAPQYTYDVFSIQGEGTGGVFRAYRNDMGYVRDNLTISRDKSLAIGADIGPPGHYGGNFNTIKTPTKIGEWGIGNHLRKIIGWKSDFETFENVYFRNPGETSVLLDNQFTKIGGTDLVRMNLGGFDAQPTIEPVLQRFSKDNKKIGTVSLIQPDVQTRKKRSQVISFLTAGEARVVGMDTAIRNYDPTAILDVNNNLNYAHIGRISEYRKAHHISQVNVTDPNGMQYVYGLPAYSKEQKDFTFTVANVETGDDLVNIGTTEPTTLNTSSSRDGFLQVSTIPAYAHSFLLTGLLTPDYVDVTGNGITEDDGGNAVKFNYSKYTNHKWRSPHTTLNQANFNAGDLTEPKDDKGIISYGERETWYLHSIESKTMIALFSLLPRNDGKGPTNEIGGVNSGDNSLKQLRKIDLYNKADLKKNGLANALPIKTVWFEYGYTLCNVTPDNSALGGKLTLNEIYFTYNGKARNAKPKYKFSYDNNVAGDNPGYQFNATDRWGNYRPKSQNPGNIQNSDYPWSKQDSAVMAQNARAWNLKKILLPSGGQIEVTYESDDYAFVQNKRAALMLEIAGVGPNATTITDKLYGISPGTLTGFTEYDHVFIKVPESCANAPEVFVKYLENLPQLAFRLAVNMPKGVEYVSCYATVAAYGVYDATRIWVQLNPVDGLTPLTLASLDYLRERLPGQAFPGYDVSQSAGLKQVAEMLAGMLDGLKGAFKDPIRHLRSQNMAQTILPASSFVRLNDPNGIKYGGGHRVKSIKLKDNLFPMTGQFTSEYGQEYDYSTTEIFNGVERRISSGVASYEPSIGNEENPFTSIVQVTNRLPLGPSSYGAIEMPVLDAFFPAPLVGYSKVTVRSLNRNTDPAKKTRSGIGRQVTEFYTAKDFPVYVNHTSIDLESDKQEHRASLLAFFYKYAFDSRALSQGFMIETNDMHGKIKSQSSYAENDPTSRVHYLENFYRNTGGKGLDEKFDFVHASQSGLIQEGNMGIDIELMTDTREFSVRSNSLEVQGQADFFPVVFPFWLPFIWPVAGDSEDTYRAVTTTKVISYHGILDSTVVIDKGSVVSTRNLVYDAETGNAVIIRSNNEFDKPVYAVEYPAWWAYSGMGLAYKNIDAVYTDIDFLDGRLYGTHNIPANLLESGDELYVTDQGGGTSGCQTPSGTVEKIWVLDLKKNTTALTVPVKDLVFIDKEGRPFTKNDVDFRIVRSGRRNILNAPAASVTLMANPVVTVSPGVRKLVVNNTSKVLNSSAVEYREKWQIDNDQVKKLSSTFDPLTCVTTEVVNCNGYFEKRINPYRKGLIGNFRPHRNLLFYGERMETDPAVQSNLPENGFLNSFQLYWDFDVNNNLVPNLASTKWVSKEQVTRFNAKGAQIENKDALGTYTSSQFGYQKAVPVAIASNSRYDEMGYDGFEDNYYSENLNIATSNICAKKHFTVSGLTNTQLINADSAGFNAHTGKYALGVSANSTATTTIPVAASVNENYWIGMDKDTTKVLNTPGGTFTTFFPYVGPTSPYFPAYVYPHVDFNNCYYSTDMFDWLFGHTQTYSHLGASNEWYIPGSPFNQCDPDYLLMPGVTTQFIQITSDGTYNFTISQTDTWAAQALASYSNYAFEKLLIYRAEDTTFIGGFTGPTTVVRPAGNFYTATASTNHSVFLCKGVYIVHFLVYQKRQNVNCFTNVRSHYSFAQAMTGYANLSTQNGCISNKPMPAKDSMLNPVFTVPLQKKMVFSAWVRETCGNPGTGVPCTTATFTNNQVTLQFNDGGNTLFSIQPSGPIIEGWQRYEGEFTAPAGSTQMTLKLINTSGSTIWFDDVRIHPYNSNMKSYVYDPVSLRLVGMLDANNYAQFYEYDEEGGLVRTKIESREGIKTISETRSSRQRNLQNIQ